MRSGATIVVSAPSGTGKSTLCKKLLAEFPNLAFSVSCATRPKREGEIDGVDYHFMDRDDFLVLAERGGFAEWAEVHGNFYGTPLAPLEARLADGKDTLLDVDVQGAASIKKNLPDARFVFILPPSPWELEQRLRQRGQDDEESIRRRLGNAEKEIAEAFWYDDLVVNDNLDIAYDHFRAIYLEATLAMSRNSGTVEKFLRAIRGVIG